MAERPLNPDEAALWRRVVETVRPAAGRAALPIAIPTGPPPSVRFERSRETSSRLAASKGFSTSLDTNRLGLDGTWDRSLAKGAVSPDRTVDLHGDTLDRAYGRIDAALADATAAEERVLLLVTGKPGGARTGRGAIRAVVDDWLAASRHAGRIAAVRPAHPRHGGAGALYVVLRRTSVR